MDWRIIKKGRYKVIAGTRIDFSHLQDTFYSFSIEASRNYPQTDFKILVQYSSHCVSWGPKRGSPIDFNLHGYDYRIYDDKGVHRCFCPSRYELSHHLPDIFSTLIDRQCLFTGHDNWLTVEVVQPNGKASLYEVFFSITRQSSRLLRLYVESAYVRDPETGTNKQINLKHRDKIKAKTLLAKKLRGEPVRRPAKIGRSR